LALYSETRRLLGDDYEFFWAEIDDVEKVVVKNYIFVKSRSLLGILV
jgi:hypothetical protein